LPESQVSVTELFTVGDLRRISLKFTIQHWHNRTFQLTKTQFAFICFGFSI